MDGENRAFHLTYFSVVRAEFRRSETPPSSMFGVAGVVGLVATFGKETHIKVRAVITENWSIFRNLEAVEEYQSRTSKGRRSYTKEQSASHRGW